MTSEHRNLRRLVLNAIANGIDAAWSDAEFNALALRIFAFQFEHNAPYRRFCQSRGATPDRVEDWRAIPALPTAAFKAAEICSFPPSDATVTYETSGTTTERPGAHRMLDTALYDASLAPNLQAHLFPDVESIRIVALAASPQEAPRSSLAHMLGAAVARWGADGSRFCFRDGQLDLEGVLVALGEAQATGELICLLGTAFAFVHLIDTCTERHLRFRLPAGSRLMDTGGYKGRAREAPKAELYRAYTKLLGVPDHHLVNEYGMTEMSSQIYDTALRDHITGTLCARQKVPPPWVRTEVLNPNSLQPTSPGTPGLLRHVDLANVDSVIAIQTEDLGVRIDDGFEVLGRASGAELRGCSLAVEEVVRST